MTMLWSSPAIVEAARNGEVGTVIRLARKAQRLTQAQLGNTCGYSQSVVSRIERGQRHAYDIRVLQQIADTLGVPRQLLGLAGETGGPVSPVNRRDLLTGAGAAAATTFLPSAAPETTAGAVRAITAAQRRLDASMPSRHLAESVRSHLRLADRAVKAAPQIEARTEMAAALSEIAGFAGWLHWDMYDLGSARRHYDFAIASAREAGDPLLTAYMTGSLAAFAAHLGDGSDALGLVASARQQLGPERPAIADAWLSAVAALAHATAGDERSTLAALDHSQAAAGRIPAEELPPWPWVFTFDPAKVAAHRLACAVRLGRPAMAFGAVQDAESLLAGSTKQAALWRLEHATAHLQNGDIDEAFTIATAVLDATKNQDSTRIVERARALRRGYTDHRPSPAALAFDDHVRATQA